MNDFYNPALFRFSISKYNIKRVVTSLLVLFTIAFSTLGQTKKVELEKADLLKSNELLYGKGVQAVFGNVKFKHANTVLYCDSAYMYSDSNNVVAYSNIHVIHNDSVHLYGDVMHYLGNQNLAKVRRNVRMEKDSIRLTTEFLDFDRIKNVGYYFNGGKLVSSDNVLTSKLGYFYPSLNEVVFKDSVHVVNPDYFMDSDTMKYHTVKEIVTILGPTTIVSDSNVIYSELGYYNTMTDFSQLRQNSSVSGKNHTLFGDTINYDRTKGLGEVYGNMVLNDSLNNMVIKGNYGTYNEITKAALATRRAEVQHIYQSDTLFMHADTLRLDSLPELSTKLIRAYRNVRFFRPDIQGRCDSMVYNFSDSTNTLFYSPIIWAQGSQMTAQTIKLFSKNQTISRAELTNSAFVVQQQDSIFFNQIKGKNMIGYFANNTLHKIDVDGNGQTVYYPVEDGAPIGVNRAESSNLTLYFDDRKIDKIILRVTPDGNINPPMLLPQNEVRLKGFVWLDYLRPKNKEDIFNDVKRIENDEQEFYLDFKEADL